MTITRLSPPTSMRALPCPPATQILNPIRICALNSESTEVVVFVLSFGHPRHHHSCTVVTRRQEATGRVGGVPRDARGSSSVCQRFFGGGRFVRAGCMPSMRAMGDRCRRFPSLPIPTALVAYMCAVPYGSRISPWCARWRRSLRGSSRSTSTANSRGICSRCCRCCASDPLPAAFSPARLLSVSRGESGREEEGFEKSFDVWNVYHLRTPAPTLRMGH